MLNFKSFRTAGFVLVGIKLIRMIRKGQFAINGRCHVGCRPIFYVSWNGPFKKL